MMVLLGKRAQQTMGLPFGMIFAMFLIVVFIVISFIAINSFLDIGKTSQVGIFYRDLQEEVDAAWNSQATSASFDIDLPSGITHVCFANLSKEITGPRGLYEEIEHLELKEGANTFLIPGSKAENLDWKSIKHLDIDKIIAQENPYCVRVEDGLTIKRDFYDKAVVIE